MAQIKVGKPHVKPDTPSHTKGVHQGNKEGNYKKQPGHHKDGTASARRSTGISPKKHDAILPIMPNLPPG
ncbi:hypothetical protein [Actinomadura algeriensis]|uniref:Uncharacterized protein n=1 Tax=Actinomadura algeriensis TaxID=1679523 RepID=A0ABR9JP41_9ACTN|nr:hypothetical protein [Actinomadura algeriensis]MBE1532184.1 hypothetical protein [Actinomadura algeriensis]